MESKAVIDIGPVIHLTEIKAITTLRIFNEIITPTEVSKELIRSNIIIPEFIKIISVNSGNKKLIEILANQYSLDMGEAEAIALAKQEKMEYLLTDDLDARIVAKKYSLKVHGTVGILIRAFREGIITKEETIKKLRELASESTLYITKTLIEQAVRAITNYKN
ncbi:hypothetical protein COU61_01135 [Candidatus Pacearchaeota archaeon CG10_big_fil_rev_8_21_14_0_10_35_13]|nr:MAG: hypothetical protein COU61_01135 [Candidatus Pacearchaeota archaeon CG10_big_fil_rev_8_21_14_0_10_35_13]